MKYSVSLLTAIIFIVLGQMCNGNESENDREDPPVAAQPAKKITGEDAETDWKQFIASAEQMIYLSDNNLKTLKFKIKNAENPVDKVKWKMVLNSSEYKIRHLKQRWEQRRPGVAAELKKSKDGNVRADSIFTANFIREMANVNREMEKVIDE